MLPSGAHFPRTYDVIVRIARWELRPGLTTEIRSCNGQVPGTAIMANKVRFKKDAINVPAGSYVDVAVAMSFPGDWMLHCHIVDHEDSGMMTVIRAK